MLQVLLMKTLTFRRIEGKSFPIRRFLPVLKLIIMHCTELGQLLLVCYFHFVLILNIFRIQTMPKKYLDSGALKRKRKLAREQEVAKLPKLTIFSFFNKSQQQNDEEDLTAETYNETAENNGSSSTDAINSTIERAADDIMIKGSAADEDNSGDYEPSSSSQGSGPRLTLTPTPTPTQQPQPGQTL